MDSDEEMAESILSFVFFCGALALAASASFEGPWVLSAAVYWVAAKLSPSVTLRRLVSTAARESTGGAPVVVGVASTAAVLPPLSLLLLAMIG